MNYKQTLDYLYGQLPMYHRIGPAAYKADLDNTVAICKLLGNPENKFRSVHIAGTNGKGSCSHMIASILQEAGYKVGLYTSPHLKDFRERIRINGKTVSRKYVTGFVKKYRCHFEEIQPSFFEWTVGLAFNLFEKKKVDIAVIEVGLGGRLDSTNVIRPLLSVITNISFDHMALLGNTLPAIAREKAGIIKTGVPVVIGETQNATKTVFIKKAKEKGCSIYFADKHYRLKNVRVKKKKLVADVMHGNDRLYKDLCSGLNGIYQQKNICTVMAAMDRLKKQDMSIHTSHIKKGIKNVVENTGLRGRWEVLSRKPLTIADTGHNEAGIREVLKQLKLLPHKELHVVWGMVNDKDIGTILQLLPRKATYYFCKASIPRALDASALQEQASRYGLQGFNFPSVRSALWAAKKAAKRRDLVFVGGSTFVVAEALR